MSDLAIDSRAGRFVIAAAVLGSGMALLDGTVVNVALVRIGEELGAGMSDLQWITNGYLLALASLILLGGSLGDRFGRRRVFVVGVAWFTLASAACGLAHSPGQLVVARVLQGVGGALLTPGSLALIQSSFRPGDRGKAIGAWSGLGGIASAAGPFVGGWLVQFASWRWAFLVNVPLGVATVWIARLHVPESRDEGADHHFDVPGAALATLALGVTTFALIQHEALGAGATGGVLALGLAIGAAFVVVEQRTAHPMVRPSLFASRQFSAANAMTLLVYAALGAVFFFLTLQLQTVLGYGPMLAGMASLPVTVLMLFLASRGGELASRIGPRLPMTLGPVVCGVGTVLLAGVGSGSSYWLRVLPGITVFGLGLVLLVAPLTATVLAAAPDRYAGVASGVNNAVARAGSLLAVAALPAAVGLSGTDYADPRAFSSGYRAAMLLCAVLLVAGGGVSWLLIRNPVAAPPEPVPAEEAHEAARVAVPAGRHTRSVQSGWSCAGSEGCPGTSHREDDDLATTHQP
ncbi:MAG: MFS transporter [Dermatophilaceae bacterium]|nr:MFS transporter [Dermatophilaceae bacterium]NUQ31451.1 MFS transporter [Dermatophilaceae bacterium]NUR16443.1 MFS transporter [Dermatophilaceae bacterium]NUR81766.1 MFS transporter [Dermatophilaceae bacterium]